ncbi:BMP-binding endothelial regulator protein [Calliphora vicina]|uniref:BMP-binding endothelial regulator protein n=1 Tax=Calliphora vicina TaxID=7373 RepID=UPI00325B51D5
MFTLENYKNSKRRRNSKQQGESNELQATATEATLAAAVLRKVPTTLSLSQTETTTKTLSITQKDHRHHSTATSRKSMKSIKNLSMPCKSFPSSSSSSSLSSWSSSLLWPLSCSSTIISGKIISRNLWRTTRKTPTLDTQSATSRTITATSLWPHAASITRRRNNCGADYCDDCGVGGDGEAVDRRCQSLRRHSHRRHFLLTLMLLLVVCIVNTSSVKAADSLTGILQSCANEGEEVQIAIKNSKCFKCACENGFVKCHQESCPPIDDCYLLEKKTSDTCCNKCKGCIFRGVPYGSGSEWTDPEDPCKSYKCVGSVVTETIMKCYTQCDDSQLTKPKPGECCPTCQGCKINGQIVLEGQEVVASIDDRCLVCQCTGNQLKCAKKTCPVLQCPISKQKLHPNECCPRCTEQREFMPLPGKCIFNHKIFNDKIQFMPDRCTNCTCTNGTSICERKTCPILECSPEYQELDGCCPRCITSEVRSECISNGVSYQNNETWNLGPCRSCRCTAGNIRCSEMRCAAIKCRSNEELKVLPGECCPKCIETAGTCTVFGDPHFKTFDGKFYSFQGSCKYLLASDCRDHSFSIRLTNDGRGTNTSSWTKTVTLKMRGIRVNLGQKMRVKVNGSRVVLPYSQGAITSIERLKESIILKTELGLSIEWDGNNYLQIMAPSSYKRRLCGLCGNYNGLARDDLTSRDGVNHTEVWRFANSWKVGGPKACSRKKENIAVQPMCKQRKTNALCRPLRIAEVFGNCNDRLNPNNYIDSCKMDVCECPEGMCHCDSFAAYARECQRLGVTLPDWRSSTMCPYGMWKRDFNTTLHLLQDNPYYGDLSFLRKPMAAQRAQRKHKKAQHNYNEIQRNFIDKHVPKVLLTSKTPDRTPLPLH